MDIIFPFEMLNDFLAYLINWNIIALFLFYLFYKVFYERVMYLNIHLLYTIFPILFFFGKTISLYIASHIDKSYVKLFLVIEYFLLYNFIVLIVIRFIVDYKELFNDLWKLITLLWEAFLKLWIYQPKTTYQKQSNITQKIQTKCKVKKPNQTKIFKKKFLNSLGVYTSTNQKINLNIDNTKRGGEALVYEASNGSLAKLFHKNNINLRYKENIISKLKNLNLSNSIVTPIEMLYNDKQEFIGYTMEKKEGVELGKILLKKITDFFPSYTLIDTIDLAISIVEVFEEIKANSIIVGDVNPRNILVNNKDTIYLIDTDSFQIGSPSLAYMEEYRRPIHRNKNIQSYLRTYKDDCFAVSTILFQLLHFGLLPYGGSDEESLHNAKYIFNPYYPEKNLISNEVLIKAHNRLSHELKLAFRDVFKYDKSVLISTFKKHLIAYKQMLTKV